MLTRRLLIFFLLVVVMPSLALAVSMGNIGGKNIAAMAKNIYFQTDSFGKVPFSHSAHGTRCNQCHPNIFGKNRSGKQVTMKKMERGFSCGACHNGHDAFSVSSNCTRCHAGEVAIKTEDFGGVPFSHKVHVDMFGCDDCHPDLYKAQTGANPPATMATMEEGASCGACHDGDTAFSVAGDCTTCHAGDVTIETRNFGGIPFSHNIHVDMFGCDDCHPDLYKAKTGANRPATMAAMEKGESCGTCHDGDTAFSVADDCLTCHVGDITIKTRDFGGILFSHEVHFDMFGCEECHPDLYKAQTGANRPATMDDMEKGKSCGACHDDDTAFGVVADCTICHAGEKVFKVEDAGNVVFPHSVHNDMFGCEECHPDLYKAQAAANQPVKMAEMEEGASCGACHDGLAAFGVADDCESCHDM